MRHMASPSPAPTHPWYARPEIPALLYLVAVLAFIKNHHALFDFPLDDAWIHQVYARAFAFGHGFAYNVGRQEAGATSPLWAILTAPAHLFDALGVEAMVVAVKIIGILLGLACVLAVQRISTRLIGSPRAGILAASLLAVDPKLLFSALSGMETCLLVATLTGACLMLMEKRPLAFLVLLGLSPVSRPEALILLPLSLVGLIAVWRTTPRLPLRTAAVLAPILPTALWVCFCLYATGHPLPNTFYLKAHPFHLSLQDLTVGASAVTRYSSLPPWLFLSGIAAFCFLCTKKGRHALPPFLFLLPVPLAYALAVLGSRTVLLEGYYWTRWIDPAALLLTAGATIGASFILVSARGCSLYTPDLHTPLPGPRARWVVGAIALLLLLSLRPWIDAFINRRNQLASDSRAIFVLNVATGKWIDANTPPNAIIGVNDAGAIRYFGRRQTIDLFALNNADIAFGSLSTEDAITNVDWVAIFPSWFQTRNLLDLISHHFEPRAVVTIPLAEYTICKAPGQTEIVIAQKKHPPPGDR